MTETIHKGEVVVVCGPSGSGKSTLIRTFNRLEPIQSGRIVVDGQDIHAPGLDVNEFRSRIGFVFQQFNLIPVMSALENVELGCFAWGTPRTRRERARAMLDAVGLAARERHRPGELSGGEQQRVALARALAKEPAIVIADEPTASLDSTNARAVAELILDTNRTLGTAFLIASHDDRLCAHLPRRIEMRDGVPGVNRELVDVCVA